MSRGISLTLALLVTLAIAGCTTDVPAETAASKEPVVASSTDAAAPDEVSLPQSFPEDVPMLDSELVVATEFGAGWLVFLATAAPADDFAAASELLTSSGFEKTVSTADGVTYFASFTNDEYQVQLTAGQDDTYGDVVGYTIHNID